MRLAACVLPLTIALTACAAEDDRPIRPPGGGGGNTGDGGSAVDAGGGADASAGVAGVVCVVDDLTDLHACPAIGLRGNVLIADQAGTVSTRSDTSGAFALTVPGPTATLRLGAGNILLVETLHDVPVVGAAEALVMERAELEETLALLGLAIDNAGIVVVEVVDDTGAPVTGATVSISGGSDYAIAYDAPGGDWDATQLGTGARGLAFIPGVLTGARTVTATDGVVVGTDGVACQADVMTFSRVVVQ